MSIRVTSVSGTKYEAAIRRVRRAEAIASRYIRRTLALPSPGELWNTCASERPAGASSGK
jgi:hypothetical protein